jgi:hypothetical protein
LFYGSYNRQRINLLPEEFLNLLHHFHKPIHFGFRVVKIKTRAGGGFHAELVHERLRAVMATAQRHARVTGHYRIEGRDYVVKDGDVLLFKFNV